ncbi:amidohydrolase family protein [Gordonia rubripertincta]|uniref:Amidohydrolase family protein n=1 Tax=Gordonia rubripertincta TaxID=36822 RepID=A0ABT4MW86_GORRU|nr:amidohydrolase family protein [Gordonia rubripertincta]MCZ4550316.1 amidohydrolase family protein [Gordonia rubripertincta]
MSLSQLHFRGFAVGSGEPVEFWVDDGVITREPIPGADTVTDGGWIMPGLVDAHNHVGIAPGLGVTIEQARAFARQDLQAGATLIREVGSPVDTHPLDDDPAGPRFIRAGKHIARPKRYLRDYGVDLGEVTDLPAEVARQAQAGDGWVKLVGDWIDRDTGDLSPLWPDNVLREAISVAHQLGVKVTAHVFGTEALYGLIDAGIDCIEHGTGLNDELIAIMAAQRIGLVPTLIQVENFPSIADGADRFPAYQQHMRKLHADAPSTFAAAIEAGVDIYAGTDAGGFVEHGRIVDEVVALAGIGLSPGQALDAACVSAREWLGAGGLGDGDRADVLVLRDDPAQDLSVLRSPDAIACGGHLV